jgi:hypothetical protein
MFRAPNRWFNYKKTNRMMLNLKKFRKYKHKKKWQKAIRMTKMLTAFKDVSVQEEVVEEEPPPTKLFYSPEPRCAVVEPAVGPKSPMAGPWLLELGRDHWHPSAGCQPLDGAALSLPSQNMHGELALAGIDKRAVCGSPNAASSWWQADQLARPPAADRGLSPRSERSLGPMQYYGGYSRGGVPRGFDPFEEAGDIISGTPVYAKLRTRARMATSPVKAMRAVGGGGVRLKQMQQTQKRLAPGVRLRNRRKTAGQASDCASGYSSGQHQGSGTFSPQPSRTADRGGAGLRGPRMHAGMQLSASAPVMHMRASGAVHAALALAQ